MQVLSAPIFDVQRFSIHDGPGIRTLVFFKGCNLKCHWCQNPESQQATPQIAFYQHRCQHTLDCAKVCPQNAINPDGFRINYEACNQCLKCVEACAYGALKPIGVATTPETLMAQIQQDQSYYRSSNGGVTFSGGEPTLYPAFMRQILNLCHNAKIHTTLETCGTFLFSKWQPMLDQLNLIYFDLKIIDPTRHHQATGSNNRRILNNARQLVKQNYPVEFRLPLVLGYTDDIENRIAVVAFLRSLKHSRLHLLSYHNMGEAKIDIIQGIQKKLALENYPPGRLETMQAWFHTEGIETIVS